MKIYIIVGYLFIQTVLISQPSNPHVIKGNAHGVYTTPTSLDITTTANQTIIEWDQFSIGNHETTRFLQPNSASTVLNRVTGEVASQLNGTLYSNGNIYIINPSGLLIGPNASINTQSFVGSTLDILNEDFLKKKSLRFSGNSEAKLVNLGKISSRDGNVTLIARYIENSGNIQAKNGTATLASCSEVLLKPSSGEHFFIAPSTAKTAPYGTGITNHGSIEALNTHLLADGNLYQLAIKHDGIINANQQITHNGDTFLIANKGSINVNGTIRHPHGEVRILGQDINLYESSMIDVSSPSHAGTILIGGSFQDSDSTIPTAQNTTIHKNAMLKANSLHNGNGGLVVIWSDNTTKYYGTIEAKGGSINGDGGMVEISGKYSLDVTGGEVNRYAPKGKPGTLLYDPTNVIITNQIPSSDDFLNAAYQPQTPISYLNVDDLRYNLKFGPVEILTRSNSSEAGDIIIESPLNHIDAFDHCLTLTSERDLIIAADIQNYGNGDIVCNVGRDLIMDGDKTLSRLGSQAGNITIKTGRDLSLIGGSKGQAHIGFDHPYVHSNIDITVGRNLNITSNDQFSLIGHTNTVTPNGIGLNPLHFHGDITIHSVGGAVNMYANGAKHQFCQIGITPDQKNTQWTKDMDISGNIHINNVKGPITIMSDQGEMGSYALIGHGGLARSFDDTYKGDIHVETHDSIYITAGQNSNTEKFAGIGFGQEHRTPSYHTINSQSITVNAGQTINLEAGHGNNHAFIGAFTGNNTGSSTLNIDNLIVNANQSINLLPSTHPKSSGCSVIGISGINGPAISTITVKTGNSLNINTPTTTYNLPSHTEITHNLSSGKIINSITSLPSTSSTTITAYNDINIYDQNPSNLFHNSPIINSCGNLSLHSLSGDLNLLLHGYEKINTMGTLDISAGNCITITGSPSTPINRKSALITAQSTTTITAEHSIDLLHAASIANVNGSLSLIANEAINISPTATLFHGATDPVYIIAKNTPKYIDEPIHITSLGAIYFSPPFDYQRHLNQYLERENILISEMSRRLHAYSLGALITSVTSYDTDTLPPPSSHALSSAEALSSESFSYYNMHPITPLFPMTSPTYKGQQ